MQVPKCKIPDLQTRFEGTLYKILDERNKGDKRFPISPSTVSNCQRKTYYELVNYNNPGTIPFNNFGLRQLLVFDFGDRTEEMVGEWLKKVPSISMLEKPGRIEIVKLGNTTITGEIDYAFLDKETNIKYIADSKTVADYTFKDIERTLTPKDSNYFQLQLYLASPWARENGFTKGLLYYTNKNTQQWLLLEFDFDEEAVKYAISRLAKPLLADKVLDREFVYGRTWQCNPLYCSFHSYCYSFYDSNISSTYQITELDTVLEEAKDEPEIIKCLWSYGDHSDYIYTPKNIRFHIDKMKTGMKLECSDQNYLKESNSVGKKRTRSRKKN